MANNEKNYFDLLPNEIKIHILSYLNTSDVVNLSTISSCEHLTYEKSLLRKVSFYKTAKCEMFSFLTNVNRCELITSLNITGVYWVPPDQLINGVRQLVNLKCLYAIGTKFEYKATHLKVFKSLRQLSTLSLMARRINSATATLPKQINKFYLYSHSRSILLLILNSICKSSNVKELWLIEFSLNLWLWPAFYSLPVSNLQRFVYWVFPYSNGFVHSSFNDMKLTFKGFYPRQLMFENNNGEFSQEIYESWKFDDITWSTYIEKTNERPFGFKDAKTLMTGLTPPSKLEYTELNMMHHRNCDSQRSTCDNQRSIIHSLLMCENMKMLKKLSISFCLCKRESPMIHPLSKVNKKGMKVSFLKSKFDEIVFNCPLIEELEIWECKEYEDLINKDCFWCISELKNLKKLSLDQFPDPGSTLFALCSKLPNLTSLRIRANEHNSTLTQGVAKSLECLPMLKDLRYESEKIDLDIFFDIVCTFKNLKLERLVIHCKQYETFLNTNKSLEKFLSQNKQLRFLHMNERFPNHQEVNLEKIVNNYKTDWHAYFAKNYKINDYNDFDYMHLAIDNLEMVSNASMIAVLDPFTHYVN